MSSIHPLVTQLRFTRSEHLRAIRGVTDDEAQLRFEPMNTISWIVGHPAWQEQSYLLSYAQRQTPLPHIEKLFASGGPASTPQLSEMLAAGAGSPAPPSSGSTR